MSAYADVMSSDLYVKNRKGLENYLAHFEEEGESFLCALGTYLCCDFDEDPDKEGRLYVSCSEKYYDREWENLASFFSGYVEWIDDAYNIWMDVFKDGALKRVTPCLVYPDDVMFRMGALYGSLCENGRVKGWMEDEGGVYKKAAGWGSEFIASGEESLGDFLEKKLYEEGLLQENDTWYEYTMDKADVIEAIRKNGICPTEENIKSVIRQARFIFESGKHEEMLKEAAGEVLFRSKAYDPGLYSFFLETVWCYKPDLMDTLKDDEITVKMLKIYKELVDESLPEGAELDLLRNDIERGEEVPDHVFDEIIDEYMGGKLKYFSDITTDMLELKRESFRVRYNGKYLDKYDALRSGC